MADRQRNNLTEDPRPYRIRKYSDTFEVVDPIDILIDTKNHGLYSGFRKDPNSLPADKEKHNDLPLRSILARPHKDSADTEL